MANLLVLPVSWAVSQSNLVRNFVTGAASVSTLTFLEHRNAICQDGWVGAIMGAGTFEDGCKACPEGTKFDRESFQCEP